MRIRTAAPAVLFASALAALGVAATANAAPAPAKPACSLLADIQKNTADIDGSLGFLRTAFPAFGGAQIVKENADNTAITDRTDARAIVDDVHQLGDAGLADQANELVSSVSDMKESIDGVFYHAGGYGTLAYNAPVQGTWDILDHVGDVELAISAAVDKIRAAGCS